MTALNLSEVIVSFENGRGVFDRVFPQETSPAGKYDLIKGVRGTCQSCRPVGRTVIR